MATSNLNDRSSSSNISDSMRDASSTIRDTARESMRTIRDTAEHVSSDVSERINRMDANEMMDRASERAGEFYDQARGWMRENNRMLYMVGGFVAVGLVGYLIGRNFIGRSSDIENY